MIKNVYKKNFGQLLYQLDHDARKLARMVEKIYKIMKKVSSMVFNQNCIYIYIYITEKCHEYSFWELKIRNLDIPREKKN